MVVDLVIKNGSLVFPEGVISGGIAIDGGRIVMVAKDNHMPKSDRTVDASGKFVIPGLVDPHVHLGTKYPLDEDFSNETPGAALGGVTTVGNMQGSPGAFLPHKTFYECKDVRSWHEAFPSAKKIGESNSYVDFFFSPQIQTEMEVNEIPEYAKRYGVTSFKFYAHMKREEYTDVSPKWKARLGLPCNYDDGTIYMAFEQAGRLGYPALVMVHCEDSEITSKLMSRLQREGRNDAAAWADRSPGFPEAAHVRKYAYLARLTNSRYYVVHLSSRFGLEECRRARAEGAQIIVETCPQYLVKTKNDPEGVLLKVNPPIQNKEDNMALWQGVADGSIQCIGTDHVVQTKHDKLQFGDVGGREADPSKNVWATGSGFPGVQTSLPIMLSEGVNKGRISLTRLVEVCGKNPAQTFGLYPRKGSLTLGADGDIVLVDLKKIQKITADMLRSRADFTIYEGMEITGWPVMTVLRGEVVMEDGQLQGKQGFGCYIPRESAR